MTVSLLDLRGEFCFASNSNPNERVLSPVLTEGAAEPYFETEMECVSCSAAGRVLSVAATGTVVLSTRASRAWGLACLPCLLGGPCIWRSRIESRWGSAGWDREITAAPNSQIF